MAHSVDNYLRIKLKGWAAQRTAPAKLRAHLLNQALHPSDQRNPQIQQISPRNSFMFTAPILSVDLPRLMFFWTVDSHMRPQVVC